MYELIKKPYEISLWGERQAYSVQNGSNIEEVFDKPEAFLNSYTKEYPIAVIGSSTMESPIKAFNPKLVRQTNGTNTLTFDIFYKYYDDEENEFKLNPFISLLSNERKVKLKYGEELDNNGELVPIWYDFIIKQVQEDSQKGTYTYTCQDLYITELSKNGYSLIFDTELENNMGSVIDLGKEILKGTEWSVASVGSGKNESDRLLQENEEAVYTFVVPKGQKISKSGRYFSSNENIVKFPLLLNGSETFLAEGSVLYIGYSSYQEWKRGETEELQFLVSSYADGRIEKDDDRVIKGAFHCYFKPNIESEVIQKALEHLLITTTYRGNFYKETPKTIYVPEIKQYCTIYKDTNDNEKEYYCYIGSEFLGATEVQNLLTNGANFTSNFGWSDLSEDAKAVNIESTNKITFDFSKGKVINSGLADSIALFQDYKGISIGDVFYLLVKSDVGTGNLKPQFWLREIGKKETTPVTPVTLTSFDKLNKTLYEGYDSYKITCDVKSYSYSDLIEERNNKKILEFVLDGENTCSTSELSLFKEVKINTQIVLPELNKVLDTAVKDKYFFFDPEQLSSKVIVDTNDIKFTWKYFKEEIPSNLVQVARDYPYEKITSITASKSNRFNLIQTLCERFECWARFVIGHNDNGSIKHLYTISEDASAIEGKKYYSKINENGSNNDPLNFKVIEFNRGVYEHSLDKKVAFKEYIGKDNYAGFKYGINLKGITRNIDSKQIVTKLIVESNSNEYASDGFCSIQRAIMNPSRENAIYNFKYYINNELIDEDELIVDLYDEDVGIGLYSKLLEYNLAAEPSIEKLVDLKTAYDKAFANFTYHKFAYEEAHNNEIEYGEQLQQAIGTIPPVPNDDKHNDAVKELINKRNYAISTKDREEPLMEYYKDIYIEYKKEIDNLEKVLERYTKAKESLNAEFFKKYSRFVQEGTWISEDYFDADLYYFDACKVSETSAFPQVSYNISVLDLSGMQEYQNYNFDIGDKTYVEDIEFFGYVKDTKRPYQEEVIISEIQSFLDSPEKNTIKVQNYKTRFEDLFQRVAAATQALQYHEGKYNRASDAIKEDNTIDGSVLERTLNYNFVLSDAISKEITQGGQVIDLNSVSQPNRYVRLSGLGIQLSKDGGLKWQTAITADGINADVGVFGSLHTNNLTIYNGDDESFYWDANGITALGSNADGVTQVNKFIRFDKFGIYGHIGENFNHYNPMSLEEIKSNSVFSLTWDGVVLNSLNNGNYVRISTKGEESGTKHGKKIIRAGTPKKNENGELILNTEEDKFIVYEDGSIKATDGEFSGKLIAATGDFTGKITAEEGEIGGWKISSSGLHTKDKSKGFFSSGDNIFSAGSGFYVTSSGELHASGAVIDGDSTFTGTLKGVAGYFSGDVSTASQFKVVSAVNDLNATPYGYMGLGQGAALNNTEEDSDKPGASGTRDTSGVIISHGTENHYIIITDGGVRLQAGSNRMTLTPKSINISTGSGLKAYYNGTEIGSGSGTAVFG